MFVGVGDRNRFGGCRQMICPEFLSRFCVEGPEASVVRSADKCQAAAGHDGATQTGTTGVLLSLGKVVGYAQDRTPGNLSTVYVDRHEFSPGRLVTWKVFLGIPEAHCSCERTRIAVASGLVAHDAHWLAEVIHIDYEESERGIEGP